MIVLGPDVNASEYDCTVIPHEADPADVVTYYGMQWRRGEVPVKIGADGNCGPHGTAVRA